MRRDAARPQVTLNYGSMLRECVRHERLAALLLAEPDTFHVLFRCVRRGARDWLRTPLSPPTPPPRPPPTPTPKCPARRNVESPHFDVASDAWATTKDLLTRHKGLVAEHLDGHFTEFFEQFALLVRSENYVTKRQSLKLLGELLLDRANFPVMSRYIASVENLKAIMIMLLDPSAAIQYEAFHVFKIFVANPRKHEQVLDVLLRNKARRPRLLPSPDHPSRLARLPGRAPSPSRRGRASATRPPRPAQEKMLSFLADFLKSREVQDENFRDEKAFLLEEIKRF